MKANESVESILKKEAAKKKYYGVYTEGKSREDMIAILTRHVHEYKEKFVTANITSDITKLVRTRSGKVEAGPGSHDDSLMSYLIGMYVLYHGDNLNMFGIYLGATDEDLNNAGLKRPEDINPAYVAPELIEAAKDQEKKIAAMDEYQRLMRAAIEKSQKQSFDLQKTGMVNTIFGTSPNAVVDNFEDNYDTYKKTFSAFDMLNGNTDRNDINKYDNQYYW